jgi:hypothetical protein
MSTPEGWEKIISRSTGKPFYLNKYTNKTQWELPTIGYVYEPSPNINKQVRCSHIIIKVFEEFRLI